MLRIPSLKLKQKLSISLYCASTQRLLLTWKFLFLSKTPGLVSSKNILLVILRLKSSNPSNGFLTETFFHTGINFIPNEKTLVVAILGLILKSYGVPSGPLGFQKYSVEQHSYNKHQSHLFGWNHFA